MAASPDALETTLTKLSLNPTPSKSASSFAKKQRTTTKKSSAPAESWEDEASDSGSDTDRPLSPQQSNDYPSAPPPTPISSTNFGGREQAFINPYGYTGDVAGDGSGGARGVGKRPEKTDAVAKRMIAGALGVRAPKKTDEQRAYERAVKEKEIKRKNLEKDNKKKEQEESERAKAAVWDD